MTSVIRGSEGDISSYQLWDDTIDSLLPVKVTGDQLNKPGRDRMSFQGTIASDDPQAGRPLNALAKEAVRATDGGI